MANVCAIRYRRVESFRQINSPGVVMTFTKAIATAKRVRILMAAAILFTPLLVMAQAASVPGNLTDDLREFVQIPAVPGYEQQLAGAIATKLKAFSPHTDMASNVIVTVGKGSPRRLIVTAIDEPGFVASGITPEGYVTVQRLPQAGNLPLFNELYSAQPVMIGTNQHSWLNGVVAGLSIHLMPQRQHPPSAADLDNMYIDLGANNEAEVRASGADVLSPIAIDRQFYEMADGEWTAPAIGDRFGAAALVDVLRSLDRSKLQGTTTFAFVTQQWLGARGLQRELYELHPDEVIYVGRCMRAPAFGPQSENAPSFQHHPGDGVLVASDKPENAGAFGEELEKLGSEHNLKVTTDFSAPLLPRGGYILQPKLPERTVHLAVATDWPSTPAEVLQSGDVASLASLLEVYLGSTPAPHLKAATTLPEPPAPQKPRTAPSTDEVLHRLIETYAASEHEGNMRSTVEALLPPWAKPVMDDGGNLVLHLGSSSPKPSGRIAIVAHMDEIGYEVKSVLPDGRLELKDEGGGIWSYFLGHPALVHSSNGMHPGVLELPEGWDKPGFQFPRGRGFTVRMDVGAKNPDEVAKLGIKPGDFITVPKKYRKLLARKASGRAMDDRVGCTALINAVWALGATAPPNLGNRDITFIWSTREELGLFGAAAAAKDFAAKNETPTYVFAVDTFVSADSPLESKRFADARVGRGFVVRAVDNSNIVPRNLAEKVVSIARANNIPAQYGVTGGGNDGAAFLMYGSTDVALGWPLRYAHSPGEVVDVRDVEALGRIIAAVARSW
ncbi:MAG: M28 family peptidase [Terriglobia bacterium]|nr:M28 family peptidase [Terriglobia bacterium]